MSGPRTLVLSDQSDFIRFVIYGLAISLIASASRGMRGRDTVILILAATIIWGVFVETGGRVRMIRFLLFASGVTYMLRLADRVWAGAATGRRMFGGIASPALVCLLIGLVYFAITARFRGNVLPHSLLTGATWGFSLGLAVGLGLSIGGELLKWMSRDGS